MADVKPLRDFTDEEAKEFHSICVQSFLLYIAVALVAHLLAWAWRPFWAPLEGYRLEDHAPEGVRSALTFATDCANGVVAIVQHIAPFAA